MVKHHRNPEFIRKLFSKEKRYLSLFPNARRRSKLATTKRLIPYAVSDVIEKTKFRVNEKELTKQLEFMLDNETLGHALNLAMKGELGDMFEHEIPTPKEIEIADEITMLNSIFGSEEYTHSFLKVFGHELLDIYSRERTDARHQNH